MTYLSRQLKSYVLLLVNSSFSHRASKIAHNPQAYEPYVLLPLPTWVVSFPVQFCGPWNKANICLPDTVSVALAWV